MSWKWLYVTGAPFQPRGSRTGCLPYALRPSMEQPPVLYVQEVHEVVVSGTADKQTYRRLRSRTAGSPPPGHGIPNGQISFRTEAVTKAN